MSSGSKLYFLSESRREIQILIKLTYNIVCHLWLLAYLGKEYCDMPALYSIAMLLQQKSTLTFVKQTDLCWNWLLVSKKSNLFHFGNLRNLIEFFSVLKCYHKVIKTFWISLDWVSQSHFLFHTSFILTNKWKIAQTFFTWNEESELGGHFRFACLSVQNMYWLC